MSRDATKLCARPMRQCAYAPGKGQRFSFAALLLTSRNLVELRLEAWQLQANPRHYRHQP